MYWFVKSLLINHLLKKTKQNKKIKNKWQKTYDAYMNRFGNEYIIRDPVQIKVIGILEVKI